MSNLIINPYAFAAPSAPTVLAQDTFTDTDGVSIAAHSMDIGSGWVSMVGMLTIQSNKMESGAAGGNQAVTDVGASEYTVTADLEPGCAIIVRYADSNHFLFANLNLAQQKVEMTKWANGVVTVLASADLTLVAGTLYSVQVAVTSATVTTTVAGGAPIPCSTTLYNDAATVGIRIFNASRNADNFLVVS